MQQNNNVPWLFLLGGAVVGALLSGRRTTRRNASGKTITIKGGGEFRLDKDPFRPNTYSVEYRYESGEWWPVGTVKYDTRKHTWTGFAGDHVETSRDLDTVLGGLALVGAGSGVRAPVPLFPVRERNPRSAQEWQLYGVYADMDPDPEDRRRQRAENTQAVRELNAALKEAKKDLRKRIRQAFKDGKLKKDSWGDFDPHYIVRRYTREDWRGEKVETFDTNADVIGNLVWKASEIVEPVQLKWAHRGASDTEPNYVVRDELRRDAGKYLKLGDTPKESARIGSNVFAL